MIPEFIGRVPIMTTVTPLDLDALKSILTKPRNALLKQYQKLFAIDDVELEFTDSAIAAVAQLALERGTGARGLRSILEDVLQMTMFEVPSRADVAKVVITEEVVNKTAAPTVVLKKKLPREKSA